MGASSTSPPSPDGNPNTVTYSASKAGVIRLTKAVAKEVVEDRIMVNCVTPVVIEIEILRQMTPEHLEYMLARTPLRRPCGRKRSPPLVAWLASDECTFSTGAVFDLFRRPGDLMTA